MKEFLANIRPPKYLRYLFFIGYCWYRSFKSERDEAHGSVIIFLGTIHIIFFMSILFITIPQIIFELGKYELVIPVFLFISAMSYYLFWYQNKWKFFLQEFSHLKRKQQRNIFGNWEQASGFSRDTIR